MAKMIKEAVGVPTNIVKTAQDIFGGLIEQVEDFIDWYKIYHKLEPEDKTDVGIKIFEKVLKPIEGDFYINDKKFKEAYIQLNMHPGIENEISILGLANMTRIFWGSIKGKFKIKFIRLDAVKISIDLVTPLNSKIEDLLTFLQSNKSFLTSILGHELKHYYDANLQRNSSIMKTVHYRTLTSSTGIRPINKLLFFSYYFHDFENSVRPTELAALLSEEGITKSNFLEFFKKTEIYGNISEAKSLSWEGLLEELRKDENMKSIDNIMIDFEIEIDDYTEDEKIDYILELVYKNIKRWRNEELRKFLKVTDFSPMRFKDSKTKLIEDYKKWLNQFGNDYEAFYKSEIKNINMEADNMLRKLGGVYHLAIDDPNPKKTDFFKRESVSTNSIVNWDMWIKLHSKHKLSK